MKAESKVLSDNEPLRGLPLFSPPRPHPKATRARAERGTLSGGRNELAGLRPNGRCWPGRVRAGGPSLRSTSLSHGPWTEGLFLSHPGRALASNAAQARVSGPRCSRLRGTGRSLPRCHLGGDRGLVPPLQAFPLAPRGPTCSCSRAEHRATSPSILSSASHATSGRKRKRPALLGSGNPPGRRSRGSLGAAASAAPWRDPGGTAGRTRGEAGPGAGCRASTALSGGGQRGLEPELLCAWLTWTEALSNYSFRRWKASVYPSVKWAQNEQNLCI